MRHKQRGASGLFVAVVLLLIVAGGFAAVALLRSTTKNERGAGVAMTLQRIQEVLQGYVAANGRLPCPANGAEGYPDVGAANPDAAIDTCATPLGTVPWKTLGISRTDALDPWGNRISYRVFDGAVGLTRGDGASMVQCDTDEPTPAGVTNAAPVGLCRATQDTIETQFLAGKGLKVTDSGAATIGDAAYVLFSHGPTAGGAYTGSGAVGVVAGGDDEKTNLTKTGHGTNGFIARAHSAPSVLPTAAAFFDDIVVYARLGDLIRKAGQGGRNWPEPAPFASIRFDAPTLGGVLGSPPSSGSLGTPSLSVNGVTVTGGNSSGAANISFTSSSVDGIGVGGGTISSVSNEYLQLAFPRTAGKFAFTVINFGQLTLALTLYKERVTLKFSKGATTLGTVTKQACTAGGTAQASFSSIDTVALFGSEFDKVEIRPISSTPIGLLGSSFYLSEIKTCAATDATCETSLAAASPSTVCP